MERHLGAIVLAAGLGTRMRSARAKVLHEISGEPMIARSLRMIAALAPAPLIVVVGHQADQVEEAARRALPGAPLLFAYQPEQRGTGDAARRALTAMPEGFAGDVLIGCGDMPMLESATLRRFVMDHRAGGHVLSVISVCLDNPLNYGRIVRDRDDAVKAIVEARDATPAELAIREINSGIYVADANFLRGALAEINCHNVQGEFYLTDIVALASRRGTQVNAWPGEHAGEFAGINTREELANMEREIREKTNQRLMAAGVTLIDPATAYIGPEAVIGNDTTIGPNVQIIGQSRIGAGVLIEGTAWLCDVVVGDRCHLKLGVRAEKCIIGDDCEIGPFANLREGTRLEGHNRIGNFVETKNAAIGRGTKASHLSYLGDVTIGRETNVGCGVITVNYDGYDKHQTLIGDNCMVGCDTQLIAPITVGSDVYVASGTTLLKDVKDGALVMSHHPRREKPGWTAEWHRRHANHPKARRNEDGKE
jgi:bifunctional UDP-N-acetylglucosamine pyrophosphorylase/glucosamine-1-phosphate N-acetyltransferase